MADITRQTTNQSVHSGNNNATADVEESFEQMTLRLAADYDELTPVYVNSSGKFEAGDASAAGTAKCYGLTTRKGKAGEAVTAIAKGVMGGYDLSGLDFGDEVFLSDTEGEIADAAGTVSVKVGEVIPIPGQPRGQEMAKMIRVMR